MSTSRHIDIICCVAILLAVVLTVLFMNGEALGITVFNDEAASDGQFTANDLNADWDTSGATQITLTGDGGNISGNGAYAYGGDIYIVYAGKYVISGELTNGSVIIEADGDDKIWLLMDGVSISCDDDAAIRVEQAGKVFMTLAEGTENTISCGSDYSEDVVSAGVDGAIYSRDDLTINGSGKLSVSAEYKHGIVCNDDMVFTGGTIIIEAVQDGVHANDSVRIADADITISAGDDGITVSNDDETAYLYVKSGSITVLSCYEGLEAIDVTVAGGVIDITSTDDGINANGSGAGSVINITGGDITIKNPSGRDADGLDSNGSIYISGGTVFISVNADGSNSALDYGSENGGVCEISGGTVIACGGSAMAEGFDSSSAQGFIMYSVSTTAAGTTLTLEDSEGNVLLSEEIPYSFSSAVLSVPEMKIGDVCTVSVGDTQEQVTVDNSTDSGGFGQFGMFGGGMQTNGGRFEKMSDERQQDMPSMTDGGENMEAPENLELPEGKEFTEGMEPPEGMEIPEGMETTDGAQPFGDMQPQDGMQATDGQGADGTGETDIPAWEAGQFGGRMQMFDGMQDGAPDDIDAQQVSAQIVVDTETLILLGVTLLVMAAGLLFAWRFRRR